MFWNHSLCSLDTFVMCSYLWHIVAVIAILLDLSFSFDCFLFLFCGYFVWNHKRTIPSLVILESDKFKQFLSI